MLLKGNRFTNYTDKVYLSVLLMCAGSFWLIGSLLVPVLSYMVLDSSAHDTRFINYATLINILPSLPFLFSAFIASSINASNFTQVRRFAFMLLLVSGVVLFSLNIINNVIWLSCYILLVSLIFRAIYFALDKQITILLHKKVIQFQSDLLILSTIGGAVFTKLGSYIYHNYGVEYCIGLFLVLSLSLVFFSKLIPTVVVAKAQPNLNLINIKIILKSLPLVKLIITLSMITIIQSPFYLLFFIKLHQLNIPSTSYANILAYSSLFSISAGVLCKFRQIEKIKIAKVIAVCLFLECGLFLVLAKYVENSILMIIVYFIFVFLSGIINIQNFAWIIRTIKADNNLIHFTSFINGVIASVFYLCYLFMELLVNMLLNSGMLISSILSGLIIVTSVFLCYLFRI